MVDSVTLWNKQFEHGLTLKEGMKPEALGQIISDEDFKFIKTFYAKKNLTPQWKVIREKCFIKAILTSPDSEKVPVSIGVEPTDKLEQLVTRLIHVPGLRGTPSRSYKIATSDEIYLGSFKQYVASIVARWSQTSAHQDRYITLKKQLRLSASDYFNLIFCQ